MHKITIKLQQHTPLIHFQHDQDEATLRASEVKPKLDKFIVQEKFHNSFLESREYLIGFDKNKPEGLKKKWESGYRALNYKVRVTSSNFQDIAIPVKLVKKQGIIQTDNIGQQLYATNNYPDNLSSLIMSNIGGRPRCEVFNLSIARSVIVDIITFSKDLSNIIADNLYTFFCKTSFGNRISKGFGSFEVLSINGRNIEDNYIDSDSYVLSFSMNLGHDYNASEVYKDVFRIVGGLWKSLKKTAGVKGGAIENVLLGIPDQKQRKPDRIPSPIRYKPYIDFHSSKDGKYWFCDVNIAIFFNKDVIKATAGLSDVGYYEKLIKKNKEYITKDIIGFLQSNVSYSIDEESINIE